MNRFNLSCWDFAVANMMLSKTFAGTLCTKLQNWFGFCIYVYLFLPEIFHISMGEWEKSIFHSAQKNDKLMLATTHSFLIKKVCMKEYPDRIAKIYAGRAAGRWLRQRSPLVRIYWEWFDLWSCRCWDLGFFETHAGFSGTSHTRKCLQPKTVPTHLVTWLKVQIFISAMTIGQWYRPFNQQLHF